MSFLGGMLNKPKMANGGVVKMANGGAALGGAAKGAASGAALGSVVPGIGTAIGAIGGGLIGGISGLFSNDDSTKPQMPSINSPVTGDQLTSSLGGANNSLSQQQAFLAALQGQNGIGNQSSVFNQLQGVANGTGPNPAQAMLNQATGNNVAQQGALMASQRGAGANPALIARQAAQQGANLQQNAAGQAATLQANQSLGALNQLGGIAQNQVGNQGQAINMGNQYAQNLYGQQLGAQGAYNQAVTQGQGSVNSANVNQANLNASQQGGLVNGLAAAATVFGNQALPPAPALGSAVGSGATDLVPQVVGAEGGQISTIGKENYKGKSKAGMHLCYGGAAMAKGGKVPALVSPGEKYLSPKEVKKVAEGKKEAIKAGETIPGNPKVGGSKNSYANDTVPKTLEEGGIVLPRSVTQSKDPAKAAHAFVSAIIARGANK